MTAGKRLRVGLGKAIRERRLALNYTTDSLAYLVDASRTSVVEWERAKTCPQIAKLPMLADALEISIVELIKLACKLGGCQ